MSIRPTCERACALVSLRLDGELSTLEERLVERHLSNCAECRAFAQNLARVTEQLRLTPLVELSAPIALPPRQRLHTRALQFGLASLAGAAAVSVTVIGVASLLASGSARDTGQLLQFGSRSQQLAAGAARRDPPGPFSQRKRMEQGNVRPPTTVPGPQLG